MATLPVLAASLDLSHLVQSLSNTLKSGDDAVNVEHLETLTLILHHVRLLLSDLTFLPEGKDVFRDVGGLETLIHVLQSLVGCCDSPSFGGDVERAFFDLCAALFAVLSEALNDHVGNSTYLDYGTTANWGWLSLQRAIADTGVLHTISGQEHLFGLLFAFALQEETLNGIFRPLQPNSLGAANRDSSLSPAVMFSDLHTQLVSELKGVEAKSNVKQLLTSCETLWNPKACLMIFNLWCEMPRLRAPKYSDSEHLWPPVLAVLLEISQSRKYNAVAMHRTGITTSVIQCLSQENFTAEERASLEDLSLECLKLGVDNLQCLPNFCKVASSSKKCSELFLRALKISREAPHFHFDLSTQGFASVELSELKGSLSHRDSSGAYTLTTWLRVETFDDSCHTTIFGAFDASQVFFLLLYLDRKSHQLVLQTSIRSPKPSVRFRSVTFLENIWYHLAVSHQQSTGRASLFINGIHSEQVRCDFPVSTPLRDTRNMLHVRVPPIQCFLGIPHDLSPRLGNGVLSSKWSMAATHLFSILLPTEVLYLLCKLGPHYNGVLHGTNLGSFQTYAASTSMGLKDEEETNEKWDNSVLSQLIRYGANSIIAEKDILLSLSADTVKSNAVTFSSEVWNTNNKKLTFEAQLIALNGAILRTRVAGMTPCQTSVLTGGSVIYSPIPLANSCWRLCGSVPIALKLVALASTPELLLEAINIYFELIWENWRNSEAMERENGYGILAAMLRCKLGSEDAMDVVKIQYQSTSETYMMTDSLQLQLLKILLKHVGIDCKHPHDAIIFNSMAYRILIIDCDLWRHSDPATQQLFYNQFAILGSESRHRDFNAKRFVRMRIVKKLIDAFKGDAVHPAAMNSADQALAVLLNSESTLSADVLRSLSLYLTYTLQLASPNSTNDNELYAINIDRNTSNVDNASVFETGLHVLATYTDFLCQIRNDSPIRKFAKTVTNKWLLHMLATDDHRIVTHVTRILAHLLVASGNSYVKAFDEKTKGFIILRYRLRRWWYHEELWSACCAILFGIRRSTPHDVSLLDPQNIPSILYKVEIELYCPRMWDVLAAMLEEGLEQLPSRPASKRSNDLKLLQSVARLIFMLQDGSSAFRSFIQSANVSKDLLKLLFVATSTLSSGAVMIDVAERPKLGQAQPGKENGDDWWITSRLLRSGSAADLPLYVESQIFQSYPDFTSDTSTAPQLESLQFVHPLAPPTLDSGGNAIADISPAREFLHILVLSYTEQLRRKDFSGLGLFLKAPKVHSSRRSLVTSLVLNELMIQLQNEFVLRFSTISNPTILTNMTRFILQACEAVFEGWLITARPLLELVITLLEHLHVFETRDHNGVRFSGPALSALRTVLRRVWILQMTSNLRLGDISEIEHLLSTSLQTVLAQSIETDERSLRAIFYLLYQTIIVCTENKIRLASLGLWRRLCQRKHIMTVMLNDFSAKGDSNLRTIFHKIVEEEEGTTLDWICQNYAHLNEELSSKFLADIIADENIASQKSSHARESRRADRLHQSHLEDLADEHTWTEHNASTITWNENIRASEEFKWQRVRQDQQDGHLFLRRSFSKIDMEISRLCSFTSTPAQTRWSIDEAEGRDKMRLRLVPVKDDTRRIYQPKRGKQHIRITGVQSSDQHINSFRLSQRLEALPPSSDVRKSIDSVRPQHFQLQRVLSGAEDFEVVSNPNDLKEDTAEISRKVMRSLERGEQVVNVYNVSRIRALEAFESLLILGQKNLYLLEGLFQRIDNQVVNLWQAPEEERDPYIRIISGRETDSCTENRLSRSGDARRHWPWSQILHISKRHFLFRDVALEIFFQDGRSYLMTTASAKIRNELYHKLLDCARGSSESSQEDSYRTEHFQSGRNLQQSVGERFALVFSFASTPPETARWIRGEISNFQYLNHVNSVAGRTINDLTQYPVFPWVIADYSSDSLDLSDPRIYRDLSKPMGCQNPRRESAFKERYKALADLSEAENPPFHYGTHYSSAMIVASYLIRLEPFVQSYLLLQGGTFDHADRLFNSVEKAWVSASRENMTDVRELIPEFYYLPEFLTNINAFNFGTKEGNGEAINDVQLPPWAKGDPQIFIDMQMKALESRFVSERLHLWIDLIFGSKQRGEAAIEYTNVYHHLSYPGKNLDEIVDPLEQRATVGIIHNFGQTPRQVFTKPHEQRQYLSADLVQASLSRFTLFQGPKMLYKMSSSISCLLYSTKQQRLLSNHSGQIFVPPLNNVLLEWGFNDSSVRFFTVPDKRELAVFEQLHQERISIVLFANHKLLITASDDCTISVWDVNLPAVDRFDIQLNTTLFGHRSPLSTIALAIPLSMMVSCSVDGHVFLWDLNNLVMVREFRVDCMVKYAAANGLTGHISLCSARTAFIFTINGRLLIEQNVSSTEYDNISSCAFATAGWVTNEVLITGHTNGVINFWKVGYSSKGKWGLSNIHCLQHPKHARHGDLPHSSAITSLCTNDGKLYTGDEEGRVHEWSTRTA